MLEQHKDFDSFSAQREQSAPIYFFSAHGEQSLYDIDLSQGSVLVFGREADGLPAELLEANRRQSVRIPFPGRVRSFNLANAVAMVLSEGMRQNTVR